MNASSEESAHRLITRLCELMTLERADLVLAPYHKGGYVVSLKITHTASSRDEAVLDVIREGQRLGRAWTLFGDIDQSPAGWSNECVVSGVTALSWSFVEVT